MTEKTNLNVQISIDIRERLDDCAKITGVSLSRIVEDGIKLYLAKYREFYLAKGGKLND